MKRIFYTLTSVISLVAWVYAIIERLSQKDWLMLIIDIVVAPIGVIDGIGMYFGYW